MIVSDWSNHDCKQMTEQKSVQNTFIYINIYIHPSHKVMELRHCGTDWLFCSRYYND